MNKSGQHFSTWQAIYQFRQRRMMGLLVPEKSFAGECEDPIDISTWPQNMKSDELLRRVAKLGWLGFQCTQVCGPVMIQEISQSTNHLVVTLDTKSTGVARGLKILHQVASKALREGADVKAALLSSKYDLSLEHQSTGGKATSDAKRVVGLRLIDLHLLENITKKTKCFARLKEEVDALEGTGAAALRVVAGLQEKYLYHLYEMTKQSVIAGEPKLLGH